MYDLAIIGGGIVGAAAAYLLSRYDISVALLEKENDVAMGATRANSAIMHAGYDPEPGTLMARLNLRGALLAREICQKLDVPYKQCGSFVVAFDESELPALQKLLDRGVKNGVPGLEIIPGARARELEPMLSGRAVAALHAPTAAIVSPWEYALAMTETAVLRGVTLLLEHEVTDAARIPGGGWRLCTPRGDVEARCVLNCAGAHADRVHNMAAPPAFTIKPDRGEYYVLDKSAGGLARRVLFQCPTPAGKGVLVSPTVHGNLIVGPNNEPSPRDDTSTTAAGLREVLAAARKTVPALDPRDNIRNFAGVRAASDADDFYIARSAPGFVEAAGIKSPGLTAAPAIAEMAARLLEAEGLPLVPKPHCADGRRVVRFAKLTQRERAELVRRDAAWGRIVCRCETVTEGEIIAALRGPVPPRSVDGVKRRVGAGMGRCQGGFCGPRVVEILARELGLSPVDVPQDAPGSYILTGETKGEFADV